MIPKIIHQVWVNRDNSNRPYPSRYNSIRQTLIDNNRDFEFKVWLDNDVNSLFDHIDIAPYREVYSNMKYVISKADFARIAIIYLYGGIYIDMDFYGYKPLSQLLAAYSSQDIILVEDVDGSYPGIINGFIAAQPRHEFFLGYMEYMAEIMSGIDNVRIRVMDTTGPRALYAYAKSLPLVATRGSGGANDNPVTTYIIPSHLILPYTPQGIMRPQGEEAYVGTLWTEGSDWSKVIISDYIYILLLWCCLLIAIQIMAVYFLTRCK